MDAVNALSIESMWAVLNFGMNLSPDKVSILKDPFSDAWNRRASILEDASKKGETDWGAIKEELQDMKKDLDGKIKATLGDASYKDYTEALKTYDKLIPRRGPGGGMRRMGGPGGGFHESGDAPGR